MKFQQLLLVFISLTTAACSQNLGPGYQFDLFKNTPNWDLAKALQNEDEMEIKAIIKNQKLDVNLREQKFGVTLLHLSVANDKLISTKVLLEEGAKLNIADFEKNTPIHEASKFINLKKNSFQILKLLIKYRADVNASLIKKENSDTIYFYVPLIGASKNLACAKLLIDNGANPYIKDRETYPIWAFMTGDSFDESIFFSKYMIVDKKMLIPNPISYSSPDKRPLDIFYFLNKENFRGNVDKENAKQQILDYLHQIDFPKNGALKDTL